MQMCHQMVPAMIEFQPQERRLLSERERIQVSRIDFNRGVDKQHAINKNKFRGELKRFVSCNEECKTKKEQLRRVISHDQISMLDEEVARLQNELLEKRKKSMRLAEELVKRRNQGEVEGRRLSEIQIKLQDILPNDNNPSRRRKRPSIYKRDSMKEVIANTVLDDDDQDSDCDVSAVTDGRSLDTNKDSFLKITEKMTESDLVLMIKSRDSVLASMEQMLSISCEHLAQLRGLI